MKIDFSDYGKVKCSMFSWEGFLGLYSITDGNPCKDCGGKNNCEGYVELKKFSKFAPKPPTTLYETNAQIAERLHITKRQVSKLKKRGEL